MPVSSFASDAPARAAGRGHGHEGEHALEHRDVHALSASRPLAGLQRGEDADRGEERTRHVRDLRARHHGAPVRAAKRVEEAAERQVVDVVSRPRGERAVLPVAGERAVDEARVLLEQARSAEAAPLEDARAVGLDEDVGGRGETTDDRRPFLPPDVHDHRALVAVEGGVGGALPVHRGRHRAHRVPEGRLLDLDHIRPEVAQQHRAVGPGDVAGQVHDPHSREGAARHRAPSREPLISPGPWRTPCRPARTPRAGRTGPGGA